MTKNRPGSLWLDYEEPPYYLAQDLADIRAKAEGLLQSDEISPDVREVLTVLLKYFRPGPLPLARSVEWDRKERAQYWHRRVKDEVAEGGDRKRLLQDASEMMAREFGGKPGTYIRYIKSPKSKPGRKKKRPDTEVGPS